jgi:hypothetical protein
MEVQCQKTCAHENSAFASEIFIFQAKSDMRPAIFEIKKNSINPTEI